MQAGTDELKIKISPTKTAILDFLRSRGGSSSVGVIGSNRSTTTRHLRELEGLGLIECLSPPEKFKSIADAIGIEGFSLTCGVWQLAGYKPEEYSRSCTFCGFTASYDDFPDGSVCFVGLMACAPCLKADKTAAFRALLDEEGITYETRFEG